MKYAVIKIGSDQRKVSEGDQISVSKLSKKEGETIDLKEVLLFSDDGKIKIGDPIVKGVLVKAKVIKQFMGEKLHIFKFKAKTGYRRKTGFRPQMTLLGIEKISA